MKMAKTITLDREAFEDSLKILRSDSMPILAQSVATDLEAAVVHRGIEKEMSDACRDYVKGCLRK